LNPLRGLVVACFAALLLPSVPAFAIARVARQTGQPCATASPDTRGWIVEANWLPLENRQNVKLGLRYTAYT